jgi:elongator complex protein 3
MNTRQKQLEQIVLKLSAAKPLSEKALFNLVRTAAGQAQISAPEKSELLAAYRKLLKAKKIKLNKNLEQFLTKRAVRTLSGVAVISVLTKPQACPGNCLFCPTEKAMPKSYLSNEPAVMRAILNNFDPFRQVTMRLKALQANGHATDKIELIVMGGTWSYHSPQYQSWFIKRCFEALNGRASTSLSAAQKKNETAKHRCIGLTLETRPDYITPTEIKRLRNFGCTRVELGIQHTDNAILKLNRRGHTTAQSIAAIKLLKDAGFKINLHLMPNLYGSTPAKDLAMFKKIYTDGNYMPDMVKIYPCVVNEHADLYKLYKQKKYKPYTDKQLLGLLVKIKKITPPWVRITRLIRDIPEESIVAGNKITNLRQLLQEQAKRDGWQCQCIRCREAGHQPIRQSHDLSSHSSLSLRHSYTPSSHSCAGRNPVAKSETSKFLSASWRKAKNDMELKIRTYQANDGTEYFLSFESPDEKILYAFLRLRLPEFPDKSILPELTNAALIRELHTYGQLAELGEAGEVQHLGLGKKLLAEAEKIARQAGFKRIAVISGIGVRQYYQKNGYSPAGTYLSKNIKP